MSRDLVTCDQVERDELDLKYLNGRPRPEQAKAFEAHYFAPTYGAWRAVVSEVVDKFLACGVLEHGFARVRCDACAHELLTRLFVQGTLLLPHPPNGDLSAQPAVAGRSKTKSPLEE